MTVETRRSKALPVIFSVVMTVLLWAGWQLKKYELVLPDRGWGYALGILGTVLMASLLLYPLRKRMKAMENLGAIKRWFQTHMVIGILGPVCILYHANFRTGSLNSNVALFSMLVVAGSGIMGRYMYSRIHHGLYGKRAELIELKKQFEAQKEDIGQQLSMVPGVKEKLFAFADEVLTPTHSFVESFLRFSRTFWNARTLCGQASGMSDLYFAKQGADRGWSPQRRRRTQRWARRELRRFSRRSAHVAGFNFFERTFSYWHVVHMPLAMILFVAVVVHVVAVNLY